MKPGTIMRGIFLMILGAIMVIFFSWTIICFFLGIFTGFIGFLVVLYGLVASDRRPAHRPAPPQHTNQPPPPPGSNPVSRYCPYCGQNIPQDSRLCPYCGGDQ